MKRTIAVIFGGRSVEHDVSIITAHIPIIGSLLASGRFNVLPIYIAKDGSWYSDETMNDLDYFKRADLEERLAWLKKVRLLFEGGLKLEKNGWIPAFAGMTRWTRKTTWTETTIKIDIVFPAMHGTFGEDGSLMGLLRMANVPFVGCDLFASAMAMDKVLTKQVLAAEGVPVVPYAWLINKADKSYEVELRKISYLNWPLFVKPAHLGSSIAISKVKNQAELENAIEVAFHYDDKILVEESVENLIEVTLPIMGNDDLRLGALERPLQRGYDNSSAVIPASEPESTEILKQVQDDDSVVQDDKRSIQDDKDRGGDKFFSFQDKYLSGNKKGSGGVNSQYSELPAKIDPKLAEQVIELGKKTYRILGCSGIARIDFLIDGASGQIYVNEVNTLPGSLYHHNWRSIGVSGVELVTRLIELAEERFQRQQGITRVFRSDVLR